MTLLDVQKTITSDTRREKCPNAMEGADEYAEEYASQSMTTGGPTQAWAASSDGRLHPRVDRLDLRGGSTQEWTAIFLKGGSTEEWAAMTGGLHPRGGRQHLENGRLHPRVGRHKVLLATGGSTQAWAARNCGFNLSVGRVVLGRTQRR